MPLAKLCNSPGCKAVTYDGHGRCMEHRKPAYSNRHKLKPNAETTERHKIYATRRWRKLSLQQRTQHPLCEECKANNLVAPGRVADHIIEIEDNPGFAYDINNLQTLCYECHNSKSALVAHHRKNKTTIRFYPAYLAKVRARR